jgi:hypothetical protein
LSGATTNMVDSKGTSGGRDGGPAKGEVCGMTNRVVDNGRRMA